jgi:hypothetical protein
VSECCLRLEGHAHETTQLHSRSCQHDSRFAARAKQPEGVRKIGILMLFREGDLEGQAHVARASPKEQEERENAEVRERAAALKRKNTV